MKRLVLIAAIALTAGCVSNQHDLSNEFGAAHRANMEAQIIDPNPAAGAPEGDGANVDIATIRYKTDKVKQPRSGAQKQGGQQSGPPAQ